jgi:hypothetical protein
MNDFVAAQKAERASRPPVEREFIINVALANDGEPRKIFVGANGKEFLIERGKNVRVPERVLRVLDDAVSGVAESDPDDETRARVVDRKRFGYTVVEAL